MTLHNPYKPILPLRNVVLFPGLTIPIQIVRKSSIGALKRAQEENNLLIAVLQKEEATNEPHADDLYPVGTLCKIEQVKQDGERGYYISLQGLSRVRLEEVVSEDGFLKGRGDTLPDRLDADNQTLEALLTSLKTLSKDILSLLPMDAQGLAELVDTINDLVLLSHLCSGTLDISLLQKQELLEMTSVKARVLKLLEIMQSYKQSLEVHSEIRSKLSQKLGKDQRDAILREQLRAIHDELGDTNTVKDDYRDKIEKAGMPEDVQKIALSELQRLESLGPSSPETHIIRNYLDLLCALPWQTPPAEPIDIEKARLILDQDHYGLEKIKKRILEHLAVMKLKEDKRGSILLFVGPPGVGKTSLGQSIAKALGRKYVRASLGGLRDDAEIRGHRRTYIGAMPGRIIQSIKRAGANNPVFILDEVDKLSRGFQGDPASALLEVLDPEQNSTFLDHYLDVSFDLSKVMFIATANTIDSIPAPLLDRMEVIELSGYTLTEKLHIAKTHLVQKQLAEHGLTPEQLDISDAVLTELISHYTREAGVRELQRRIAALCRAAAQKIASGDILLPITFKPDDLDTILGPERFTHEVVEAVARPGVTTGLAWTPMGGDILFIESTLMPGTGKLTLTGQLGEVMKESAQIALSAIRAILPKAVEPLGFDKKELHIHVPAGAIPKDGPSAGIAIAIAIASLFTGKAVDPKLAMTGELTLRGTVMPVGGIKEKVIAAHRAGIKRVILPKRNEKDIRDIPAEVKTDLTFYFVSTIEEVLSIALNIKTNSSSANHVSVAAA